MAEELALDEILGDGGTVELHQDPVLAGALRMDGAGDDLLAGAGLAQEEHAGIGRGDLAHVLHHRAQALRGPDEIPLDLRGPQLLLQVEGQAAQFPHLGLGLLALLDVAQDQRVDRLASRLRLGQAGLDGKDLAVGAHGLVTLWHPDRRLRRPCRRFPAHVLGQHLAQALREESFAGLADGRACGTSKHPLGGAVEQGDATLLVDRDDRVHRRFKDVSQPFLVFSVLLLELLQFKVGGDTREHLFVLEGFGDVIDGADRKPLDLIGRGGQRGHEDDGNISGGGTFFEQAAGGKPIHLRHHHVEEDKIGADIVGLLPKRSRHPLRSRP